MKKEMKICLPPYKIGYALAFVLILCVIRSVVYEAEIGAAMDPLISLLALAFCADTYAAEASSGRREILRLAHPGKVAVAIKRRMMLKMLYLLLIALLSYGLFHWQKPLCASAGEGLLLWAVSVVSLAGSILFWGGLSNALSTLCRNMWAGISLSFLLWMFLFSTAGQSLGNWNVLSFAFRNIGDMADISWLPGKILGIGAGVALLLLNPLMIKKRG